MCEQYIYVQKSVVYCGKILFSEQNYIRHRYYGLPYKAVTPFSSRIWGSNSARFRPRISKDSYICKHSESYEADGPY